MTATRTPHPSPPNQQTTPEFPSLPPTAVSGIGAMGDLHGGIGVVHGDVYQTSAPVGGAEKLQQGISSLRRHDREQALRLIGEAIDGGLRTATAYYHLALAVLSGRSAEELTSRERAQVSHALAWLTSATPTRNEVEYHAAGRLIARILPVALATDPDTTVAAALLTELGTLPAERAAELRGHLLRLLAAVRRDAVDADEDPETPHRTANRRAERVPLYFTPDPAEPRVPEPPASLFQGLSATCLTAAGVLSGVGLVVVARKGGYALLCGMIVLLGAFVLLAPLRARIEQERAARARQWLADAGDVDSRGADEVVSSGFLARRVTRVADRPGDRSSPRPASSRLPDGEGARQRRFFLRTVSALVDRHFRAQVPGDRQAVGRWREATEEAQLLLVSELTHAYGHDTPPGEVDWLVRHRARSAADQWRRGAPPRHQASAGRQPNRSQLWGARLMSWGALASVVAYLVDEIAEQRRIAAQLSPIGLDAGTSVFEIPADAYQGALLIGVLWLVTARLVRWGAVGLARERLYKEDLARHAEDRLALVRERQRLRERPSDVEMARWLDLDQRVLLREMLREHRAQRREVLFSFFVLEGARNCVRAKEVNGPTRYSRFALKLFVLTTGGVWISTWEMTFATGQHSGRRDMVFRFDSVNSVVLETIGVRFGRNRREIVPTAVGDGTPPDVADYDEPVIHEALRLVLNTGEHVDMLIENFDQLRLPGVDDPERLRAMTLENTGVLSGFRVLAALATEGPQWLVEQRETALQELASPEP
ncbi:hypothetical protein ACTWP5_06415 [Streptomyces sp. 4N509B]|uniref:hypothetical protein n=1 Tax=Streptomyces sp. 4N509B TaxID=3457413 RepID=UPI003FD109BC